MGSVEPSTEVAAMSGFGNRVFALSAFGALFLFFIFIATYLVAVFSHTNLGTFWEALSSREVLLAIELSLVTATISTLLSALVAVPSAYVLSRARFRGKALLDTFLDIPVALPPVALGLALLVALSTPIGQSLQEKGIRFVFERPGIVLAQFAVVSSYTLRMMRGTFESISPRFERVARTLGATSWQAFIRVAVPMARPGLLTALILTWAKAMGEFGATLTLAGAVKEKTEVLSIAIWLNLALVDLPKAIAVVLILIVVSTAAILALRRVAGRTYTL